MMIIPCKGRFVKPQCTGIINMKRYLLDTNVLINDPHAIYGFGDNEVIIPTIVVRELDGIKKRQDAAGAASRYVAKELDKLRAIGPLHLGVVMENGGMLRIVGTPEYPYHVTADPSNDDKILQACIDNDAILITEDTMMRILADSLGIRVEACENLRVDSNNMYEKCQAVSLRPDLNTRFHNDNRVYMDSRDIDVFSVRPYNNEFFEVEGGGIATFRWNLNEDGGGILYKIYDDPRAMNLKPKNKEQQFALDALFDPDIDLVVLAGPAGCGKTLCAVAAGLELTSERCLYKSTMIARPTVAASHDVGFLPGDLEEKLDPWMGPIWDSVDVLVPPKKGQMMSAAEFYKNKEFLKVLSLSHIRGRSLPKHFIIIDEAQNLSRQEAKTILTRAGEGTKIVLTGDPSQIDSPYLDQENNGMSYVIEKFRGMRNFAHIFMHKGERSKLAEMSAKLL
jgi:PhoH-like ATPase